MLLAVAFTGYAGEAHPATPARTAYEALVAREAALRAAPTATADRPAWRRLAAAYRRFARTHPPSGYADDALLHAGDLSRDSYATFHEPPDLDAAIDAYKGLIKEYPASSLRPEARLALARIAFHEQHNVDEAAAELRLVLDEPQRGRGATAVRRYRTARAAARAMLRDVLAARPSTAAAAEDVSVASMPLVPPARAAVASGGAETSAPAGPPASASTTLPVVREVRHWNGSDNTRVAIYVDREVEYREVRLYDPDRIAFDLLGAKADRALLDKAFAVEAGILKQIRVGQNTENVVRVVLDFDHVSRYSVFSLYSPYRLVIDILSTDSRTTMSARTEPVVPTTVAAPAARRLSAPRSLPARPLRATHRTAPPIFLPAAAPGNAPSVLLAREAPKGAPSPAASDQSAQARTPASRGSAEPAARVSGQDEAGASPTPPPVPFTPPSSNVGGNLSLARQLGLGIGRIVIDPGHGGQDPGAGPANLREKDLVLDIALRLEQLLKSRLGLEVILTRREDSFVPLEARTALANQIQADLFLSIHANSSRNRAARGIETYVLNFAKTREAAEVAARENAISTQNMRDLQGLVRSIALNNKLDESRDFAAYIQKALVTGARKFRGEERDLGVKPAPFYVLIGANMPSVLAEISFVSNRGEARALGRDAYRQRLAEALFDGIRRYLRAVKNVRTVAGK